MTLGKREILPVRAPSFLKLFIALSYKADIVKICTSLFIDVNYHKWAFYLAFYRFKKIFLSIVYSLES